MSLELRAPNVTVRIDPEDGGRMSSLVMRGHELFGGVGTAAIESGSFVMAPWAGRIRFGRLTFGGVTHDLPLRLPPHAGHGTVVDRPWTVAELTESSVILVCDLGEPWPLPGRVTQEISVEAGAVTQRVTVAASGAPFPACIGWHPWFRRRLEVGGPLAMSFDAAAMLVRDSDGMPTDERVGVGDGPWDDCFAGVRWPIRLDWPGALTVEIVADTEFAVLYNLRDALWCVEPQTGPPNDLNDAPRWVTVDEPLSATTTWRLADD